MTSWCWHPGVINFCGPHEIGAPPRPQSLGTWGPLSVTALRSVSTCQCQCKNVPKHQCIRRSFYAPGTRLWRIHDRYNWTNNAVMWHWITSKRTSIHDEGENGSPALPSRVNRQSRAFIAVQFASWIFKTPPSNSKHNITRSSDKSSSPLTTWLLYLGYIKQQWILSH